MRIWHQSYNVLGDVPRYEVVLEEHVQQVTSDDVTVDVRGMDPGTYPTNFPITRVRYLYITSLLKEQYVRAALQAQAEGYDAFFIANIADTGFEEIRSLLEIPVIAYGQASMLFGATLGEPVGVVSFAKSLVEPQLRRLATQYGIRDLLGPVVPISIQYDELLEAFERPAPIVDRFVESARAAIELGANVLMAGEGPLNTLIARAGVSDVDGVPVLDSMAVGLALCEVRARFYRKYGLTHSKQGFFYETPPAEVVEATRRQYLVDHRSPQDVP